ncbi:hybrid sensor histidine kinase/response regulator [Spirochaeta cellobiosiphila]|uniref:hybrid sensor histidine kinase/response regulator n=1 Tax=Spirochaeta cellobiosiphila TaxID=504483 RepID=UPI0003F59216|nr:hybrid sensor histidine kinase/response regulator [Spirochaeta cellobiosiphila]
MNKFSKKLKVLIVEDDPIIHRVLKEQVEQIGHTVIGGAYSRKEAFDILEIANPELLILDIVMPDGITSKEDKIAGITISKNVMENQPIPIIWLTAYDTPQILLEAEKLGIGAYLVKPTKINDLARSISIAYARFEELKKIQKLNQKLNLEIKQHKKTEEQLLISNNTKNRLLKIIAHDLRNLYHSQSLGIESLYASMTVPEDIPLIARELYKNSVNQRDLLYNLLDWADKQDNNFYSNPVSVDIVQVVQETISLYEKNSQLKDIQIKFESSEEAIAKVDLEMLKVILRNLLSNSIKFTPKGGQITIKLTKRNNNVELQVKDTGIGISPEKLDILFDNNSHISSSKGTNGEKGAGLGLELCKDFIQAIGGTISATSELNKGSTFIVSFLEDNSTFNKSS